MEESAVSASFVSDLLHRLAHRLHMNSGSSVSWWAGRRLWVGFKCWGCGSLSGIVCIGELLGPESDQSRYLGSPGSS